MLRVSGLKSLHPQQLHPILRRRLRKDHQSDVRRIGLYPILFARYESVLIETRGEEDAGAIHERILVEFTREAANPLLPLLLIDIESSDCRRRWLRLKCFFGEV